MYEKGAREERSEGGKVGSDGGRYREWKRDADKRIRQEGPRGRPGMQISEVVDDV